MDKFIQKELSSKDIEDVQIMDIDVSKFEKSSDHLQSLPNKLIELRSDLFLKFTK